MLRTLMWMFVILGCSSVHAQIGFYKFNVATADVRVFLNELELTKTADFVFSGSAVEGKYKLKAIKRGFNEFIREIHINTDDLLEINIELEYAEVRRALPRRPQREFIREESGKLMLLSDPPQMATQIDDRLWDPTPVVLVDYPAGRRRIRIGADILDINLPPYGIKRLLWKDGVIREINAEIQRPDHGEVRLESVQIAFSKNPEDLYNWQETDIPKFPDGGMAEPIFKIDKDEWRLLCFLRFSNSARDTVEFAQEFSIANDDSELHKHQSITKVSPRGKDHLWLYHTLRTWSPGYYSLTISDDRGPMAIIYFSLHY